MSARVLRALVAALVLVTLAVARLSAQPLPAEFGDAPGDGLAYPGLPAVAHFPSCLQSPFGFIKHIAAVPILFWGPGVDFELDANAGSCAWPPFDADECSGPSDLDAGLLTPDAFTITGGIVTSCTAPQPGRSLGGTCAIANWGASNNIDLAVSNLTGNIAYINVAIDWNQDGQWTGSVGCAGGTTPEWVIQNLIVPTGFVGPVSLLFPPPFRIGPNAGYVWARFTVHDGPPILALDWDGSGNFDSGETEDYLLQIDQTSSLGEYGDAPDGVLAYPPAGTMGRFPTCTNSPGFVFHALAGGGLMHLGPTLDTELDGNHANCGFTPYDADECGPGDGDAGLTQPGSYTIDATGNYQLCAGSAGATLGAACDAGVWGGNIDLTLENSSPSTGYLHVLADWDHNGLWDGTAVTCPAGGTTTEQVIVNLPVPSGFSGSISALTSQKFLLASEGYVWFRFSLTDAQVPPDWDGAGSFGDGETEDYLLLVDPPTTSVNPDTPSLAFRIEYAQPNPTTDASTITYVLAHPGHVSLWVADLAGRRVATLLDGNADAGRHAIIWSGLRDDGQRAGPGIYYIRGEAAGLAHSLKLVRVQ